MSLRNECLICDQYPYTQIYFERGICANNNNLTEITNEKILKQIRYDFNKEFLKNRTLTPLICGTIINRARGQGPFTRKLKMLRAPLFSLLALS